MVWLINAKRNKLICERVRKIRIKEVGDGFGSQKAMARTMGIPYTTYRGYESNRTNYEFLREFAMKLGVALPWLLGEIDVGEEKPSEVKRLEKGAICFNPEKGTIKSDTYKVYLMLDQSMVPTIPQSAHFGVLPFLSHNVKEIAGKIVACRYKNMVLGRRAILTDSNLTGVPVNPDPAFPAIPLKKSNLLGEIIWVFKTIP